MKLDENKIYYLEELTNEELQELFKELKTQDTWRNVEFKYWSELDNLKENVLLFNENNTWAMCEFNTDFEIHNAKELFYTLENVQVDVLNCTQEEIKAVIDIYKLNNVKYVKRDYKGGNYSNSFLMSYNNSTNEYPTITYEKFMELFGSEEVKGLTNDLAFIDYIENSNLEISEENFKEITNSIADLLIYKNEKYGNSALSPLDIFNGKSKVGQRIDDKLARVKNSKELRKNDIADLLGYLTLVCQENNWTNFDEFKD